MPKTSVPYTCPRCGYNTPLKPCMRKHLFINKKPCATIMSSIPLTDEIKEHIINYRIYKPEKEVNATTTNNGTIANTINNYNVINNFISQLDPVDKLTKFMEYNKTSLIGFEQNIEDKYEEKANKIDYAKKYKETVHMKQHDLLEIIDDVSKIANGEGLDDLNILYDSKTNKLKVYGVDGENAWKEMLMLTGVIKIIATIQDYYLNKYECYLLRRINDSDENAQNKQKCKELLEEYYRFIGCFDIDPYVKGHSDIDIMYNSDDEKFFEPTDEDTYDIEEKCYGLYVKIRDKITKSEVNSVKKQVIDVIKRNTKRNVDELNKKVVNLFQMDEEFKFMIVNNLAAFTKPFVK